LDWYVWQELAIPLRLSGFDNQALARWPQEGLEIAADYPT
jgi:hypothetical protein